MPNQVLQPIIGDSFGDVARQRQWYVGRNDQVEAANAGRAAEVQAQANSYFTRRSEQAQQEADRQAVLEQQADQTNAQYRWQAATDAERKIENDKALAESKRQYDDTMKFRREQLGTEKEAAQGKLSLIEKQQQMKIDHAGEVHALQYAGLQHDRLVAQRNFETLSKEDTDAQQRISDLSAKKKATPEESAELARLTIRRNALRSELRKAQMTADRVDKAQEQRIAIMGAQGFSVDEDNGRIMHEPTGKTYNFKEAVKQAQDAAAPPGDTSDLGAPIPGAEGMWSRFGPPLNVQGAPVQGDSSGAASTPAAPVTRNWVRDSSGTLVLQQ